MDAGAAGARRRTAESHGLARLLGFDETAQNRISANTVVGVVFLLTLPLVTRGCALLRSSFSRALVRAITEHGRMCPLWMYGCRRHIPTKGSGRRWRHASASKVRPYWF